jgi:hypothetical protein
MSVSNHHETLIFRNSRSIAKDVADANFETIVSNGMRSQRKSMVGILGIVWCAGLAGQTWRSRIVFRHGVCSLGCGFPL